MKPVKFPHQNCIFAENQPEYLPLPAFQNGVETISCWKATIKERIRFLFSGTLWLRQCNFGGPLQPQLPTFDNPFQAADDFRDLHDC